MIMCILELFGFLNKRCQNRSKLVEKLRRSLFKSGPVRFRVGKSISFKLCQRIYLSVTVIETTLVFENIAK